MAFEGLSEKLQNALRKMTGKGKLNEQTVKEGMREVRMALLEADVNYAVAKDFIKKVNEKNKADGKFKARISRVDDEKSK